MVPLSESPLRTVPTPTPSGLLSTSSFLNFCLLQDGPRLELVSLDDGHGVEGVLLGKFGLDLLNDFAEVGCILTGCC